TCVGAGTLMAALALAGVFSVTAVLIPQAIFMLGVGMILPQTMAGALANFPQMAGSASALFGFAQMTVAALVGMMVGHFHDGTSLIMALAIAGCGLAGLLVYLTLVQRFPAPGFEPADTRQA
ncbi:MAG: Bcr/CflA family drug resistance efflux transporter, partial [Marinobacter sp.]|nr:Bcr/CflA family drug resistance efflux transporter [Marinobacter sp.]